MPDEQEVQDLRSGSFALTFLDYDKYKEFMENDELGINKETGIIYYKNKEGSYLSISKTSRMDMMTQKINRVFNHIPYKLYTFPVPTKEIKVDGSNILYINNLNETIELTIENIRTTSLIFFLDVVSPIDTEGTASHTDIRPLGLKLHIGNDAEMVYSDINVGKPVPLAYALPNVTGDTVKIDFMSLLSFGEIPTTYMIGLYIAVVNELPYDPLHPTDPSDYWKFDGTVKFDGTKRFF